MPLVKAVDVEEVPGREVTAIKLLSSPLVMPTKGRNKLAQMEGALLLAATKGGKIDLYTAMGKVIMSVYGN
jgi:hypothetical protein